MRRGCAARAGLSAAVGLSALLLLAVAAAPAGAAGPRSGVYSGKTSQKLPFALYLGQAKRGELGRPVIYTGWTGKLNVSLREVATVKVRVACAAADGTRWSEIVPVRILGPKRNRFFSDSGDYVLRRGRFRYAPLNLTPRRGETWDHRIRGRVAGRKAAGTVELRVDKLAEAPLAGEAPKFASCSSGRVKWKARRARHDRAGGTPRIAPPPVTAPRRARFDSYFTQLLDGTQTGGQGTTFAQAQGGGSFTGYLFKRGGGLEYCRRAPDGTRDYRSGTWTVLSGYLWHWPSDEVGHAEGTLRLSVPGSVVEADVAVVGYVIAVAPKGGQLGSATGSGTYGTSCTDLEGQFQSGP